jgi:hypothetical protein
MAQLGQGYSELLLILGFVGTKTQSPEKKLTGASTWRHIRTRNRVKKGCTEKAVKYAMDGAYSVANSACDTFQS